MTDAERALWRILRSRQLEGFKFRRQHSIGRYVVDFVCLERKVVIEVDGGHHAERFEADSERTKYLESEGFRVIRLWNSRTEAMFGYQGDEALGQSLHLIVPERWRAQH